MKWIPRQPDWDYPRASEALTDLCKEGQVITVFSEGIISNNLREDGKQLGAALAVLYQNGCEWRHKERVLGETVTADDTALRSILIALDIITDFLSPQQSTPQLKILIASPSDVAITKATDTSPHEEQPVSLECLEKIGAIVDLHPNVNIRLLWLPRSIAFIGFRRAKQLALEAICTAVLNEADEPHSIKNQKGKTEEEVIATWAERWHQNPRTSLSYSTALSKPPDGKAHPTLLSKKESAEFSRLTLCTMYRIITRHAFIGSYTQRFYPDHTPDQIACPCGERIQSVEHVLLGCPLLNVARHKHLTARGRPQNLPQLFDHPKRVIALLRFLEETGICAKPRTEWEPG